MLLSRELFNGDPALFVLGSEVRGNGIAGGQHEKLPMSYPSAEASELPDSTRDIYLYGYSPSRPEVAFSTGVNSGCTSPTFIRPIFLMLIAAFRSRSMARPQTSQ